MKIIVSKTKYKTKCHFCTKIADTTIRMGQSGYVTVHLCPNCRQDIADQIVPAKKTAAKGEDKNGKEKGAR